MIVQDSDIIQKINYYLPDQIRVWGYVETQKSFHAKKLCDSRKYEYLLPTYTLMPLFDQQQLQQQKEEIWKLKQQFRISKARLDQFKQVMTRFIGTHKFHNYTIKHDDSEMYVKRHIKSIIVDDPQVVNDNQMEWIRIHLHGQSFMLHQIRKMISMAILTLRTETPLSIIDRTFEDGKINIPKAPALGLLLNQPVYDGYNAKIDLDQREPILFDKYKVAMESFKKSYIDDTIFKTEMEHRIFDEFLDTFDKHYPIDLDYKRAQESIDTVNQLIHAIAALAHIEQPLYMNRLAIQKLKIEKEPLDTAYQEAETKLNCGLEEEKKRTAKGIEKATALVKETKENLDVMEGKVRELEEPNEKNEVDHRTLVKYREDVTKLLDDVNEHFKSEKELKEQVDDIELSLQQVVDDNERVKKVRELIKISDMSLLEAILDLRQSNKESSVGKGQVYFPEIAFQSLKEARELYPDLPSVEPPQEYKNEADDTGAYYSPMQRYLWDVRKRLTTLLEWCDNKVLDLMDHESKQLVALGEKVDQWNMERRRLVLDIISQ
ncbi:pseudouridine synthase [Halteromyces radiatus]|uniref:pseudouridine synthase n=1 Tax=Halteromyces radiatus TaxID=101107 RepID=UPI00221E39C9|nr:pseudouridine synthase [Halteromyces radiatus]KAI8088638.1 pseudouridine synthase [Halteromyces radiatus]